MKVKSLRFSFLMPFFSILIPQKRFSFKNKNKTLFLDERLKRNGVQIYHSHFVFKIFSPWIKENYYWEVKIPDVKKKGSNAVSPKKNFSLPFKKEK